MVISEVMSATLASLVKNPKNIEDLKNKSRNWVEKTHDIQIVGESLYGYYDKF